MGGMLVMNESPDFCQGQQGLAKEILEIKILVEQLTTEKYTITTGFRSFTICGVASFRSLRHTPRYEVANHLIPSLIGMGFISSVWRASRNVDNQYSLKKQIWQEIKFYLSNQASQKPHKSIAANGPYECLQFIGGMIVERDWFH